MPYALRRLSLHLLAWAVLLGAAVWLFGYDRAARLQGLVPMVGLIGFTVLCLDLARGPRSGENGWASSASQETTGSGRNAGRFDNGSDGGGD